jgi:hypothetical protein
MHELHSRMGLGRLCRQTGDALPLSSLLGGRPVTFPKPVEAFPEMAMVEMPQRWQDRRIIQDETDH